MNTIQRHPAINEEGYYTGSELQWNVEDVEICVMNSHPELELSEGDYERILVATLQGNEHLMQKINEEICSTIEFMIENGQIQKQTQ